MISESVKGTPKQHKHMLPTRKIALSFLAVIFVGSLLLALPISNLNETTDYINHLFVAVSATCVTGLVPVVTAEQYSLFGQIVILFMIQIGGLGFLTFLYIFLVRVRKKLSLNSKIVLQEALNQESLNKLPLFIRKIILFTLTVEGIGALFLASQFIGDYGIIKGSYYAIFHSVSAFCNAGFDVLGNQSLIPYQSNVVINTTIMLLIFAGGLGFVVWFDIGKKIKEKMTNKSKYHNRHLFQIFSLQTKMVLIITTILIILPAVAFFIIEMNNPHTLGPMNIFDKIQTSLFQSITLRTAGFATVDVSGVHDATKLMMSVFMFIGGSPGGTAGGIKTVTFAVGVLMVYNIYKGRKEVTLFCRRIPKRVIIRAFVLISISLMIVICGLFVLALVETTSFVNLLFETVSAFATVGLSAAVTPTLTFIGKIVIMILMFIGRIGPITMIISFARKSNAHDNKKGFMYPDGHILIG